MLPPQDLSSLIFKGATGELKSIFPLIIFLFILVQGYNSIAHQLPL